LQIFDDDDVIKRNQQQAEKLAQALQPIAAHSQVSHVRQRGMIAAFDVSPTIREGFARRFFVTALQKELLLRPIGMTVYWMPPFMLSDDEMALLGERTLEVLQLTTH
jgi:adenosylmethionine-8-amino-7-oxononanoate aminotransferase